MINDDSSDRGSLGDWTVLGEALLGSPVLRPWPPSVTEAAVILHDSPYEIIEYLGCGGMGAVYLVRNLEPGIDRLEALKILRPGARDTSRFQEGFLREIGTLSRLRHPGLTTVFRSGESEDGYLWFSMEYLDGKSLDELIKSRHLPLPPERVMDIMRQLCSTLRFIHGSGRLHRDLKPANVMVCEDGSVRLLDFGIACETGSSAPDLHLGNKSPHTPGYAAPEQIHGGRVDERTDLYGLGRILNAMIRSVGDVHENQTHRFPQRLLDLADDLLAFDQADRPASAMEVAEKLDQIEPGSPGFWGKHRNPFRGLFSYEPEHSEIFFGRDSAIRRGRELLQQHPRKPWNGFLLITGASGVGKSSLARAGLGPALLRGEEGAHGRNPTAVPIICDLGVIRSENDCLLPPLATILAAAFPALESGRLLAALRDSKADLRSLLGLRVSNDDRVALCLIVDQFEHFWRLGLSPGAQKLFLTAIGALAGVPGVAVLCTLRGDCYHHCVSHPVLMELKDGRHLDLSPPQPWEIAAMLRLGARAAALTFETGPDGRCLDDVLMEKAHGNPQALPLLSYVLDQLWEHRDQETNTLRHAVFDSLGGFEGAIAEKASATCEAFVRDFPNEIAAACNLFHLIVGATDSGTGIHFVRRRASPEELAAALPAVRHLSEYLVESRLLVNDANGVAFVHDALLSEAVVSRWPALKEWMDENARNLLVGGRITQRCRDWSNHGRTDDLLLPAGALLTEAEALLASNPVFFRMEQRDFIQRSSVVAKGAARRAARRRRLAFSFLGMLALIATAAAIWAGKRERDALAAQQVSEAARADAEKSRLQETKARATAEGLIRSMTFELRDKLVPLGKIDLLDDVFCQALEYFHHNPPNSPELLLNEGATWDSRTTVLLNRGDTVGARAANKEALAIIRRLQEKDPSDRSTASFLGTTYSRLGQIEMMEERPKEARENLMKAVKIFTSLSRQGDSMASQTKIQLELNVCYMALARIAVINGDLQMARELNNKAISGANSLMAIAPTDYKVLLCLGESYRSLNLLASAENNHKTARDTCERAIEIAGKLIAMRPEDPSAKDLMGYCLLDLGATAKMAGDLERAREAFTKAADTLSALIKTDSRNMNIGVPLGRAQLALGRFSLKEGDLEEARVRFQSALELFETHVNASPKVDLVGIHLIETYEAMASLAEAEKDPEALAEWRRKLSDYQHKKGRGKVVFAESIQPSAVSRQGSGTAYARFLPAPAGALLVCSPVGLYLQDRNGERKDLWPEADRVKSAVCNRTGSLLGGVDDDGAVMLRRPPPAPEIFVGDASGQISMWGLFPGPDGTRWVSVDNMGRTLLREFPSGRTLAVLYDKGPKGIDVAFSPDGTRLAGTDRSEKNRALVWDTRSGTRLGSLTGHKAPVWKVFWSNDGKTIGTSSEDRTARLWDPEHGKELVACRGHAGIVFKIGFHPDGGEIITASADGSACVWSTAGAPLLRLVIPGSSVVHAGFSPDGKLIATQSNDQKLRLWNRATGRNVYTSDSNVSFGDDDMFSPDSAKLVIPYGGGIRVVDLATIRDIEGATGAKD